MASRKISEEHQRLAEYMTRNGLSRHVKHLIKCTEHSAVPSGRQVHAVAKESKSKRQRRTQARRRPYDIGFLCVAAMFSVYSIREAFCVQNGEDHSNKRNCSSHISVKSPFSGHDAAAPETEDRMPSSPQTLNEDTPSSIPSVIGSGLNTEDPKERLRRLVRATCGKRSLIVLNMFPNARSGWGYLAMNIFVRLAEGGFFCPILTDKPEGEAFLTEYDLKSRFLQHFHSQEAASLELRSFQDGLEFLDCTVFHAIPGTFDLDPGFRGAFNIGYLTVEQADFRSDEIARAKTYDFIVSPSSWNERILRRFGFHNVATVFQGVEVDMFPSDDAGKNVKDEVRRWRDQASEGLRNKFVIFSGGKMEYRKGQDIVVEAFRSFSERHDDAVLVTLWYNRHKNMIPVIIEDFGISSTEPASIVDFLASRGIPGDRVVALPYVDQDVIIGTLLRADVALFTNRAEGASNLLALESFASGTPTIISNNTGHQDIVGTASDPPRCFPLNRQAPVHRKIGSYNGHLKSDLLRDWGESSVDEILENLEYVYSHRDEALKVARSGSAFARNRTWEKSIRELGDVLRRAIAEWQPGIEN